MSKEHLSKFTSTYLRKFFDKHQLPVEQWEYQVDGQTKTIKNTQVIEQILSATPEEQSILAEALQELDANHHNINQFLKHLALDKEPEA